MMNMMSLMNWSEKTKSLKQTNPSTSTYKIHMRKEQERQPNQRVLQDIQQIWRFDNNELIPDANLVDIENLADQIQAEESEVGNEQIGLRLFRSLPKKRVGSSSKSCVFCMEGFLHQDLIKVLPCKHYFHYSCLKPWFKKDTKCPTCRLDVTTFFEN